MSPTTYTTCSNPKCLTKFSISSLQNSPTPSLILCLHCQGRVCACGGPKQPEVERCIRCRNRSVSVLDAVQSQPQLPTQEVKKQLNKIKRAVKPSNSKKPTKPSNIPNAVN